MKFIIFALLLFVVCASAWVLQSGVVRDGPVLLHVACDPTRELWADVNQRFLDEYSVKTGQKWAVQMSHGSSGSQARSVIDGLDADVVSLAIYSDTDALARAKLLRSDWVEQLPNRSLPYTSTIVFVVRKGNPKHIHDWPDLVKGDVQTILPNPKTSGNGKWAVLAAWAACQHSGMTDAESHTYMKELFRRVPVLDPSARNATATFASKKRGDVHLTWENEAILEVLEAQGELEIVYPRISIVAEPHVGAVDTVVERRGTGAIVQAYFDFLYTDAAQHLIAKHNHRPSNPKILAQYRDRFPELELVSATTIAPTWDAIQAKFFAEGAAFDRWMNKE